MKRILTFFGNILQIVIKLALAVVLVFSSFTYLNKVFYNKDVYRAEDFRSLPENCLDVLVLGSSHAQYSFNPAFFYEETGLYSYVLGSSCQPFKVSYQMLKEGLKTQSPKTVILEVYTALPLRSICEGDSCYVRAEYEMTGEEKYETINYLPEEKAAQYRNDFVNYHNDWRTLKDWKELLPGHVFAPKEEGIQYTTFGYVYNEPAWDYTNFWLPATYLNAPEAELREEDLTALNDILTLCNEKGIQLYLYKTPMDQMDDVNYGYLKKVFAWAEENGVDYCNFLKEAAGLEYFMNIHSDSYHPYINGAAIITHELANRITAPSYAYAHAENAELTQLYHEIEQGYTVRYLPYEVSPFKVLLRYQNTSGYVILHYLKTESEPLDELKQPLNAMVQKGIDYTQNYFALIHNGELVTDSNSAIDTEINGHTLHVSANQILIDGAAQDASGPLTLMFLTDKADQWYAHHLEYRGYTWEWGYHYYTKD